MRMAPKRRYRDMTPDVAAFVRWLYFVGRLKQGRIGGIVGIRQSSVSRIVSEQTWATTLKLPRSPATTRIP